MWRWGSVPELDRLNGLGWTYQQVGATRGRLPSGYHHVHRVADLGSGRDCFERAVDAVTWWRMHRGAGLRVSASAPVAAAGVVVVLALGSGPLGISAPCRVVYTVDEPTRRGFAYGTLPGHPESGEEVFTVELTPTGAVRLAITAFSRPATLPAKLAGPGNRAAQRLITDRYIRALRHQLTT